MRRPVVIGLVLATLVAGGAVAMMVHARLDKPAACAAVPVAAPDKPSGTATTAPDGGGLRVVEQGFTNINYGVSYGAIVENTSASVAYRTQVTFGFSTNGEQLEPPPTTLNTQQIPIILPGQRIGVGTTASLPAPYSATSVELRLGETTWLNRTDVGRDLGPVTATLVRSEHPNHDYPGYLEITYTSATNTCRQLAGRGAATVLRDPSGTIIGGTLEGYDNGCSAGTHITARGELMPVADDTRTQVFPYCDLQRPPESITNQIAN